MPGDTAMDGSGAPEVGNEEWYKPFASELDWRVAQWMVEQGIGHNAFNEFLRIPGVKDKLGLSYSNTAGLHKVVDSIPRRAGKWKVKHLSFPDRPAEKFTLRHRDILESVRSLWGDPELAEHLGYKPSTLFTDESQDHRLYNEMWTGKWWSFIQDKLPEGRTIAPLIVSTDKTQLTQFSGSRQAYPVYLTLGNIPSHLRRKPSQLACILVAYLPIDKMNRIRKCHIAFKHPKFDVSVTSNLSQ
ncbi:hypothetical protein BDZ89DRAFT_1146120 [Hymenopellis radicata]|nr:hypothetical protein BDZ89DRAFT_1146120 [Hymenopellis radicata]